MKNIFVIGSSHASRIVHAMKRNKGFIENYNILDFTKPGATFDKLTMPNFDHVQESDYVILQCFGNDLMDKNILIEKSSGKKIIHLLKFVPRPLEEIKNKFLALKNILEKVKGQYYIIDNPIRHLHCCSKHKYPNLHRFQIGINKLLRTIFGSNVLNHEKLLNMSKRKLRKVNYLNLFCDSVHLKTLWYETLVASLLTELQ